VAKALGDDLSGYDTAPACENQYRTTIASKAALIVVDDVWSKTDIEQLLAESPRSRFLFTTRDASIGRFVSVHAHRADLLDVAQSRELLALWAHRSVAELPSVADEVIAECGRLPLALSVVGACCAVRTQSIGGTRLICCERLICRPSRNSFPMGRTASSKQWRSASSRLSLRCNNGTRR
jgi:NB-ARC domain